MHDIYYILDPDGNPVSVPVWRPVRPDDPAEDEPPFTPRYGGRILDEKQLLRWADWLAQRENRCVAHSEGPCFLVSTIFLGIDRDMDPDRVPRLFETAVREPEGTWQVVGEWSTIQEARHQHQVAVKRMMHRTIQATLEVEALLPNEDNT